MMEWLPRLWEHIDVRGDDECWPMIGVPAGKYGQIWFGRSSILAHRLMYELVNGKLPRRHVVMHACDNPPCCNPRHLVAGTQRDNMRDMMAKGRKVQSHAACRLTDEQVRAIRRRTDPHTVLASEYGVSATTIRWVRSGKRYARVAQDPA